MSMFKWDVVDPAPGQAVLPMQRLPWGKTIGLGAQHVVGRAAVHPRGRREAVADRQNILIAGGTSSGKTTFTNALLAVMAGLNDRVIILEDTVELQCHTDDHVQLRTAPGMVSMAALVRSTLRQRPDRIVVGEVRGAEALDLLKAWGTGHPGGIATLHANSAYGALMRLEQLTLEAASVPPRALIADTVNVIVFLAGRGAGRRVREIARVTGLDGERYTLEPILCPMGDLS